MPSRWTRRCLVLGTTSALLAGSIGAVTAAEQVFSATSSLSAQSAPTRTKVFPAQSVGFPEVMPRVAARPATEKATPAGWVKFSPAEERVPLRPAALAPVRPNSPAALPQLFVPGPDMRLLPARPIAPTSHAKIVPMAYEETAAVDDNTRLAPQPEPETEMQVKPAGWFDRGRNNGHQQQQPKRGFFSRVFGRNGNGGDENQHQHNHNHNGHNHQHGHQHNHGRQQQYGNQQGYPRQAMTPTPLSPPPAPPAPAEIEPEQPKLHPIPAQQPIQQRQRYGNVAPRTTPYSGRTLQPQELEPAAPPVTRTPQIAPRQLPSVPRTATRVPLSSGPPKAPGIDDSDPLLAPPQNDDSPSRGASIEDDSEAGPLLLQSSGEAPARDDSVAAPLPGAGQGTTAADKLRRIAERTGQTGLKNFCPVVLRDNADLADASDMFVSTFEGETYLLSSAEAKQSFDRNPQRYAPVFRGFDVVLFGNDGQTVKGSLDQAAWFGGRLYLFTSAESLQAFHRDPYRFARLAHEAAAHQLAADIEK